MSTPGGNERRRAVRHLASLPVHEHLDDGKTRTAMVRQLSVTGAQVLTQGKREVGTHLTLSLFFYEDSPSRDVKAHVVRAERRDEDPLWRWLTVVEFETHLTDLEPEIREMAEHQEKVFGPRKTEGG
jgi:hypothetical protein